VVPEHRNGFRAHVGELACCIDECGELSAAAEQRTRPRGCDDGVYHPRPVVHQGRLHGGPQQVPLGGITADGGELLELGVAVHALGAHPQTQAVRRLDDQADQHCVRRLHIHPTDELLIEFHPVQREAAHQGQRRGACPESVHRQTQPGAV